jgi:hypothetical protein
MTYSRVAIEDAMRVVARAEGDAAKRDQSAMLDVLLLGDVPSQSFIALTKTLHGLVMAKPTIVSMASALTFAVRAGYMAGYSAAQVDTLEQMYCLGPSAGPDDPPQRG